MDNTLLSFKDQPHTKRAALWKPYVPLIFSLFYFIALLYIPFDIYDYILIFVGYAVFIVLYALCVSRPKKSATYIIAIGLLVVALSSVLPTSSCLLCFAAYFASYVFSGRKSTVLFVFILICLAVSAIFAVTPLSYSVVYAGLPTIGLFMFGAFDKQAKKHLELQAEKNEQIESLARIAEREKIARDMHDILGHSLTAIALKSQLAEKLLDLGENEKSKQEIFEITDLTKQALEDIREAVSSYKKQSLDERVQSFQQELLSNGFNVEFENTTVNIPPLKESVIILFLMEATTNILRHSKGDKVAIELSDVASSDGEQKKITVIVSDNGKVSSVSEGNGVIGMRERIEQANGVFNLNVEDGFTLTAIL